MTERHTYRGGSRSSFGAQEWHGSLTGSAAGGSTTIVTAVALARIKRMQVICMMPGNSVIRSGYLAFYRELPDTTTQVTGLEISDPQVLRPKVFVTNATHAIYVELYLEAITLDVGEKLHLIVKTAGADGQNVACVSKWYVDRQLHV